MHNRNNLFVVYAYSVVSEPSVIICVEISINELCDAYNQDQRNQGSKKLNIQVYYKRVFTCLHDAWCLEIWTSILTTMARQINWNC